MTAQTAAGRLEDVRDAAPTLFAERGDRATTEAGIGGASGLRGRGLYKHVEGKSVRALGATSLAIKENMPCVTP